MRHIATARFGRLTIDEGSIITFPEGLIEFPHIREFAILGIEDYYPFLIFSSVDDNQRNVCFPIISPSSAFPDYQPPIPEAGRRLLQIDSFDDVQLYCLVSFDGYLRKTHVNLKNPIVVNISRMTGYQVELGDEIPQQNESVDIGRIIGQSCP